MGADLRLVPATEAHARELAPRLREEDAAEILASGGFTPLEALLDALAISTEAYAVSMRGELALMFGIVPGSFLSGEVYPWALTSAVVERFPRAFLRGSREVVGCWLERYPLLVQEVDARYRAALRWARAIGFDVAPAAPFGLAGRPFHRITARRAVHV